MCAPEDSEHGGGSKAGLAADVEEEEELFEINLEVVNNIPPPHYWESYFTATSNALLANCLLPIAAVSSAVPMVTKACEPLPLPGMPSSFLFTAESALPGKLLGFPYLGPFGFQHEEMEASS
ncbi:hypothetical protein F0562_016062 [Nyssa sinensis]|uniref:Uncharacterized protein n=1 Tax=Nyssa sinensis TaxID=561372 RepID=A0A5J4ZLT0_9ASTE|nr:hypothetical protein F0562_016062 [Nyssa sinensis]